MSEDHKEKPAPSGLIFLSHSAKDKDVVERIVARIDNSILFYDIKTMTPGVDNMQEMEDSVLSSSLFVFFVSPNVDKESWAQYEVNIAKVKKIKSKAFQVLVVPIKGASYSDAPAWMASFFAIPASYSQSDIVRSIRFLYEAALSAQGLIEEEVYLGREQIQTEIKLAATSHIAQKGVPLNAVILNGIPGMGRTTLAKHVIPDAFPGLRKPSPIFNLPDAAGAIDIYLRLFEDIHGSMTQKEIEDHIRTFPEEPEKQAELIFGLLGHWSDINQAVILSARWGFRSRGREMEPFLQFLLTKLRDDPNLKVVLITTRRLPAPVLAEHENTLQFPIEELSNEAIADIIDRRLGAGTASMSLILSLAPRILGHPATAQYVSALVQSGRSLESILSAPDDIYAFQDKVLSAIFDEDAISELEKNVLAILSWFPNLSTKLLSKIIYDGPRVEVSIALWNLHEHSFLTQSEAGGYRVAELIRSRTRRDIERISPDLYKRIRDCLEEELSGNDLPIDLIEAILFAFSSVEGEIPDAVKALITPSSLRNTIEREYDLGRGASSRASLRQHFTAAAKLAQIAENMAVPNKHTLEDIYFFGGDALARLGRDPKKFVDAMRSEGFASADFLEGSYKYHKLRDFKGAVSLLRRALNAGYFVRRTARLLANIYLRTGKAIDALGVIDELPDQQVLRDSGLLSLKIRALRATGNAEAAAKLEAVFRDLDDDYGEFEIYKAAMAFRNKDLTGAKGWIGKAKTKPRANKVTISFFDCTVRLEEGDESLLSEACELARAAGRENDASQLLARAALKRGDASVADSHIKEIENKNYFDFQLELQILQALKQDAEYAQSAIRRTEIDEREAGILQVAQRAADYVF